MSRSYGKHNIVGNEVGKTPQIEFSRRRWSRPRRRRALGGLWLAAMALATALAAFGVLRAITSIPAPT